MIAGNSFATFAKAFCAITFPFLQGYAAQNVSKLSGAAATGRVWLCAAHARLRISRMASSADMLEKRPALAWLKAALTASSVHFIWGFLQKCAPKLEGFLLDIFAIRPQHLVACLDLLFDLTDRVQNRRMVSPAKNPSDLRRAAARYTVRDVNAFVSRRNSI